MSARAPAGASSRPELFSSNQSDAKAAQEEKEYDVDVAIADEELHGRYGLSEFGEKSPLQLEHMIGFAGDYRNTVLMSQIHENVFVRSMGNLVSIENLQDPHDQRLLRGHDMPVSALAISPSGNLIASGQIGTKTYRGYSAPVFTWSTRSGRRHGVFKGLTNRVNLLAFSTDERFLCGCGEDLLLYIWDVASGEVILGQKMLTPVTVLTWVEHKKVNQYMSYELIVGYGSTIAKGVFTYDAMRTQWSMKLKPFAMPPSGGIIRSFNCIGLSPDRSFILVGTVGGEMMTFRRDTEVFRACIPLCSVGLQSLVVMPTGDVICGGGDGSIRRLRGHDLSWNVIAETAIDHGIRSISLSSGCTEVIVACATGAVYRCLTDNLSYALVTVGHTDPVCCISFGSDSDMKSLKFVTGTASGEIRVWDISDYACLATARFPKSGAVQCLDLVQGKFVLSGWKDGFIRCHDAATLSQQLWYIPSAHRDGTKSLHCHLDSSSQYIASGGGDGAIRVWRLSNRELVTQYTEHTKSVTKVLTDLRSPNVVHSLGLDGTVLSYDLKAARRVICHMTPSGNMTDMTQRRDNELELISCDGHGRLFHWDIDYRDPVQAIQDPSRVTLRTVAVSPTGKYLAFAGDDCLLKVMDIHSGQMVALGQGHSGAILALSWTPDEQQLITCGSDSCLCVWNFYLSKA